MAANNATSRQAAPPRRHQRRRAVVPTSSISITSPSPGSTPRLPLRMTTTLASTITTASSSRHGHPSRAGRQNTASTSSASTALANTIGFASLPARSTPSDTCAMETTNAINSPVNAPYHRPDTRMRVVHASHAHHGNSNAREGLSSTDNGAPSLHIETATTATTPSAPANRTYNARGTGRPLRQASGNASKVAASISTANTERPFGTTSKAAAENPASHANPRATSCRRVLLPCMS